MTFRVSLVSRLITVTCAPSNGAPLGSVTTPAMLPVGAWARTTEIEAHQSQNAKVETNEAGFLTSIYFQTNSRGIVYSHYRRDGCAPSKRSRRKVEALKQS